MELSLDALSTITKCILSFNLFSKICFKTIGIFSVVYFAFNFLWGINYLRLPVYQSFKFEDTQYTTGQLDLFANKLEKLGFKRKYNIDYAILEILICAQSEYFIGSDTSLYSTYIIGEKIISGKIKILL